ncbi:MAG: hypothetical protein IK031_04845 [Bacteroidales bacterium]|nr:hypothetical protein [Bacteroidales bacterium]
MTTVLHLSALYTEEGWAPEGALALDLRMLDGTNCYCSPKAGEALRAAIAKLPPGGINWIDTGDYHYLTKLMLERIGEPFVLALYDNHPDDQDGAFDSGLLSCGNWVKAAREGLPYMKADYLNTPEIPGGLPVYLSIDLDVLSKRYARTDWSQGDMAISRLLSDIGRIAAGHRLLGVDVCGGLTAGKGASSGDYRVNAGTRRILQDYLSSQPLLAG